MSWSLEGKSVLLTGGSRGIGRTLAIALAQKGCRVAVLGKTMTPHPTLSGTLPETVAAIEAVGGQGLAIAADVRSETEVREAVEKTASTFGTIDILIHNAGALWWKSVVDTPPSKFDLVMGVNGRAAHLLAHYAAPYLCDGSGGHFLVMSPPIAPKLAAGKAAYMASKYTMSLIAFAIAEEWRSHHISANALWPETLIQSAATETYKIGSPKHWYKSELVSDAALHLLSETPLIRTGEAVLAMGILREYGVSDFTPYRCDPNFAPPELHGASLPVIGGQTKSDGRGELLK